MSDLPRYLLRNCNLMIDRDNMVGQIPDITIPELKKKMEAIRYSGMIKEREVHLGYEKTEFSFSMGGLDPKVVTKCGVQVGNDTQFLITAALRDEDGTVHSAVFTVRGTQRNSGGGTMKPGEMLDQKYEVAVNWYKLEIDGVEECVVSDFDVVIRGVSQYAAERAAMLL